MAKQKGSIILLEVEDLAAPGTYFVCAGQDNLDLNRSLATSDSTTKDSYLEGFKEFDPELLDWNISLSGAIELNDGGFDKLDDAFLARTPINVRVIKVSGHQYTGKGIITNFSFSAPLETAKYTIDVQGTGKLTKAVQPAQV